MAGSWVSGAQLIYCVSVVSPPLPPKLLSSTVWAPEPPPGDQVFDNFYFNKALGLF